MKMPHDKKSFSVAVNALKADANYVNKQIISVMKPLLKKAKKIRNKADALYDIGETESIEMSCDDEYDLTELREFYICLQITSNELHLSESF